MNWTYFLVNFVLCKKKIVDFISAYDIKGKKKLVPSVIYLNDSLTERHTLIQRDRVNKDFRNAVYAAL